MKWTLNFIIFNLLFATSFQTFGFGETVEDNSTSIANSRLFINGNDGVNNKSISTIQQSRLTQIYISNSISSFSVLNNSIAKENINAIGFTFPFKNKHAIQIQLTPYTRTNNEFHQTDYELIGGGDSSSPLAYNGNYIYKGGIAELQLGFSSIIIDKIHWGIKWNSQFGNLNSENKIFTYDINYNMDGTVNYAVKDSSNINHKYTFVGNSFTIDSRTVIRKSEFALQLELNTPMEVEYELSNNGVMSNQRFDAIKNLQISDMFFGYKYGISPIFSTIVELQHRKSRFSHIDNLLNFASDPNQFSMHSGLSYTLSNPKIGFWNSISIHCGGMYRILEYSNIEAIDQSFSAGFGFSILKNTNFVNVSAERGKRDFSNELLPAESYFKLNIGISSRDTWFKKIRRK